MTHNITPMSPRELQALADQDMKSIVEERLLATILKQGAVFGEVKAENEFMKRCLAGMAKGRGQLGVRAFKKDIEQLVPDFELKVTPDDLGITFRVHQPIQMAKAVPA